MKEIFKVILLFSLFSVVLTSSGCSEYDNGYNSNLNGVNKEQDKENKPVVITTQREVIEKTLENIKLNAARLGIQLYGATIEDNEIRVAVDSYQGKEFLKKDTCAVLYELVTLYPIYSDVTDIKILFERVRIEQKKISVEFDYRIDYDREEEKYRLWDGIYHTLYKSSTINPLYSEDDDLESHYLKITKNTEELKAKGYTIQDYGTIFKGTETTLSKIYSSSNDYYPKPCVYKNEKDFYKNYKDVFSKERAYELYEGYCVEEY